MMDVNRIHEFDSKKFWNDIPAYQWWLEENQHHPKNNAKATSTPHDATVEADTVNED